MNVVTVLSLAAIGCGAIAILGGCAALFWADHKGRLFALAALLVDAILNDFD